MAIAAANGHKIYKMDTKQAFLYGDMGEDIIYLHPPDWWQEPIPEGHVLLLVKSITAQNKRSENGTIIFRYGRLIMITLQ
jgi:hypothetical protein